MVRAGYRHSNRHQQGVSLLEALIALLVLVAGLMVLFGFYSASQANSYDAKVHTAAVALAEQHLQQFYSYLAADDSRLNHGSGPCAAVDAVPGALVEYTADCEVTSHPLIADLKQLAVTVSWLDRGSSGTDNPSFTLRAYLRSAPPAAPLSELLSLLAHRQASDSMADLAFEPIASDSEPGGQPAQPPASEGSDEDPPPAYPHSEPLPPSRATCNCYFEAGEYFLTVAGGACCSESGCQSSHEVAQQPVTPAPGDDAGPPTTTDTPSYWAYHCQVSG